MSRRPIRWFKSSRKHRIGRASALHVMASSTAEVIPATDSHDERLLWIGPDERGRELEVVALNLPDAIIVIHVFPTALKGRP